MSDDETIKESTDQYSLFGQHMENYNVEASALRRKLQSKIDALRIMRKELEKFRTERDQFKLMAETLQLRYSTIRRSSDLCCSGENKSNVAKMLHETRERNIKLTTELEALKQKLSEMHDDIELLRQAQSGKFAQKVQVEQQQINESQQLQEERANFICHLENLKKKNAQLAFDVKALIDEKEELTLERDAYKCKAHRLNHELLGALKANKMHPKLLDIDGIILENKYLHERVKTFEVDLEMSKQTANKYKTMLESKRKKGIIKLGSSSNEENILSHKQVKCLLESGVQLPSKTETIQDLKSLCLTLLDNLNDRNLALSHQKKTNKILGSKITELEQRIQALAGMDTASTVSGYSPSEFLLEGYCPSLVDSNETTTTITTTAEMTETARNDISMMENENNEKITSSISSSERTDFESTIKPNFSDDAASSMSTESARSVLSSEYGGLINGSIIGSGGDFTFNEFTNNALFTYRTPTTTDSTADSSVLRKLSSYNNSLVTSEIEKERVDDLKDLPPELAALVQQALHELDIRDFESQVVMNSSSITQAKDQDNIISSDFTKDEYLTDNEDDDNNTFKIC